MTTTTFRVASAVALSLCVSSAAWAQTKTSFTYCGTSDVGGLNAARATALPGTSPGLQQELWCEGRFLGYSGRYYTVLAEAYGSTVNRGGLGKWEMRVGSSTVRSSYVSTLAARQKAGVNQNLLSSGTSKDVSVFFLPIRLSGNLALDLDVDLTYGFGVSQVNTNGMISGHATGSLSAAVTGTLASFWSVQQSHTVDFGRQQFNGKAEVLRSADNSSLRYDMGAMRVYLSLCAYLGPQRFACSQLISSARAAISVVSFM